MEKVTGKFEEKKGETVREKGGNVMGNGKSWGEKGGIGAGK